jgi:hypothetical protein
MYDTADGEGNNDDHTEKGFSRFYRVIMFIAARFHNIVISDGKNRK